jgi:hypothetical protein
METNGSESESTSPNRDLGAVSGRRNDQDDVTHVATVRPSNPQRRYLERGLDQPGGKLPLFDREGRQIPRKTIEACISNGWAEQWTPNPIKPDWLVCRLTVAGYRVLGATTPPSDAT